MGIKTFNNHAADFLQNTSEKIIYQSAFSAKTVFGTLQSSTVIDYIINLLIKKPLIQPDTLVFCLKGFGIDHIINRKHHQDFSNTHHYEDVAQVVVAFVKKVFENLSFTLKQNNLAVAYEKNKNAFIFAVNMEPNGETPQYVIAVCYVDMIYETKIRLVIGTLYTATEHKFNLIRYGNERYLSLISDKRRCFKIQPRLESNSDQKNPSHNPELPLSSYQEISHTLNESPPPTNTEKSLESSPLSYEESFLLGVIDQFTDFEKLQNYEKLFCDILELEIIPQFKHITDNLILYAAECVCLYEQFINNQKNIYLESIEKFNCLKEIVNLYFNGELINPYIVILKKVKEFIDVYIEFNKVTVDAVKLPPTNLEILFDEIKESYLVILNKVKNLKQMYNKLCDTANLNIAFTVRTGCGFLNEFFQQDAEKVSMLFQLINTANRNNDDKSLIDFIKNFNLIKFVCEHLGLAKEACQVSNNDAIFTYFENKLAAVLVKYPQVKPYIKPVIEEFSFEDSLKRLWNYIKK